MKWQKDGLRGVLVCVLGINIGERLTGYAKTRFNYSHPRPPRHLSTVVEPGHGIATAMPMPQ